MSNPSPKAAFAVEPGTYDFTVEQGAVVVLAGKAPEGDGSRSKKLREAIAKQGDVYLRRLLITSNLVPQANVAAYLAARALPVTAEFTQEMKDREVMKTFLTEEKIVTRDNPGASINIGTPIIGMTVLPQVYPSSHEFAGQPVVMEEGPLAGFQRFVARQIHVAAPKVFAIDEEDDAPAQIAKIVEDSSDVEEEDEAAILAAFKAQRAAAKAAKG